MQFLRSRVEHLADHLRGCIARGELPEKLPPIREWSARLGVSHGTLEEALRILKRDGLVRSRPGRGFELVAQAARARPFAHARLVRAVVYSGIYPKVPTWMEVLGPISQQMESKGIRFSLEICSANRLRAILAEGENPNVLLLLVWLPPPWLKRFASFRRSALLLAQPAADIRLPFIGIDLIPALRHATWRLAQRGFKKVSLLMNPGARKFVEEEFLRICATAPRPVAGEVGRLPDELYAQTRAAEQLAARVKEGQGLIVCTPISPALLQTAVLRRGWAVPEQVEVVAVTVFAMDIRTVPVPVHYPYPVDKLAQAVSRAAVHYFEQGTLPPLRKLIPLEVVVPH
jgi:DNA-binding LacI/PurR family transcriptional regulator